MNPEIPLELEGQTPLWIYTANRPIGQDDAEVLSQEFRRFSKQWLSHGRPVFSFSTIVADRFFLLAADVDAGDISGCGIDASVRELTALANSRGIEWLPALMIAYLDAEGVQIVDRRKFRELSREGIIDSDTVTFDTSLNNVGQYREQQFARKCGDSWHARLLDQEVAAAS